MARRAGKAGAGAAEGERPDAPPGWDEPEKREPLSRRRILEAAVSLVDAEGLEALSMRRLPSPLGCEAMALYRHFPNKAAIVDGIIETVWMEMKLPSEEGDPWDRLRQLAWAFRELSHRHPKIYHLLLMRTVYLPAAMRPIEVALETLRAAGLEGENATHALVCLTSYIYGYSLRELARLPGQGPAELAPWYDPQRFPQQQFPRMVEVGPHFADYDFDAGFELGFEAMLAGLPAQLAKPRRPKPRPGRAKAPKV
jgi:TetR/AcrR family tetracycline transcriptional repressor